MSVVFTIVCNHSIWYFPLLPLHAAGAVAAHEFLHIGHAHAVEVTDDAVLEAGGRHGELQRLLPVIVGVQPVDKTAGKARSMMSLITYRLDS